MDYYAVIGKHPEYEVFCATNNEADARTSFEQVKLSYNKNKINGSASELVLAQIISNTVSELDLRLLKNSAGRGIIKNRLLKNLLDRILNSDACDLLKIEKYDINSNTTETNEKAHRINNLKSVDSNTCYSCGTKDFFSYYSDSRGWKGRMCNSCGTVTFLDELELAYPGYEIPANITFD